MGISTIRYKLLAFAMGGAIGSIGGALFAVSLGSLTIASFQILVSITALAVIILGGLGSIPGVVVGALVLIGLPGLLTEFEDYRLLIYGAALIGDHAPAARRAWCRTSAAAASSRRTNARRTMGEGPARRKTAAERGRRARPEERGVTPLLEVAGVSKHFGGLYALNEPRPPRGRGRDRLR